MRDPLVAGVPNALWAIRCIQFPTGRPSGASRSSGSTPCCFRSCGPGRPGTCYGRSRSWPFPHSSWPTASL